VLYWGPSTIWTRIPRFTIVFSRPSRTFEKSNQKDMLNLFGLYSIVAKSAGRVLLHKLWTPRHCVFSTLYWGPSTIWTRIPRLATLFLDTLTRPLRRVTRRICWTYLAYTALLPSRQVAFCFTRSGPPDIANFTLLHCCAILLLFATFAQEDTEPLGKFLTCCTEALEV
jgi:hypothetical protein